MDLFQFEKQRLVYAASNSPLTLRPLIMIQSVQLRTRNSLHVGGSQNRHTLKCTDAGGLWLGRTPPSCIVIDSGHVGRVHVTRLGAVTSYRAIRFTGKSDIYFPSFRMQTPTFLRANVLPASGTPMHAHSRFRCKSISPPRKKASRPSRLERWKAAARAKIPDTVRNCALELTIEEAKGPCFAFNCRRGESASGILRNASRGERFPAEFQSTFADYTIHSIWRKKSNCLKTLHSGFRMTNCLNAVCGASKAMLEMSGHYVTGNWKGSGTFLCARHIMRGHGFCTVFIFDTKRYSPRFISVWWYRDKGHFEWLLQREPFYKIFLILYGGKYLRMYWR